MKPESTWNTLARDHPDYLRSDRGLPLVAEFYPFFPWNKKMVKEPDAEEPRRLELKDYGCSVAVDLYLRLQIEGFCLFSFLFLISIPDMLDNLDRNKLRYDCRAAVKDNVSPWPSGCGYDDLPIRTNASLIQWPSTGYVTSRTPPRTPAARKTAALPLVDMPPSTPQTALDITGQLRSPHPLVVRSRSC
eukprot:6714399-Prymnesium_polylepis.1